MDDVDALINVLWEAINDPDGTAPSKPLTAAEEHSYRQVAEYILDSGYGPIPMESAMGYESRVRKIRDVLREYHATVPNPDWKDFRNHAMDDADLVADLSYAGYPINQYIYNASAAEALPDHSILLDPNGGVVQKGGGLWYIPGNEGPVSLRGITYPIILLYTPTERDT